MFQRNAALVARRKFCKSDQDGIFSFNLRRWQASGAPDCQHNVLHELHASGERAYYVAPMFTLGDDLYGGGWPWLFFAQPWRDRSIAIANVSPSKGAVFSVPMFRGLMMIPPHRKLNPAEAKAAHQHKYCFNRSGEVTFHSEIEPGPVASDLLDVISNFVIDGVSSREGWVDADAFSDWSVDKLRVIFNRDESFGADRLVSEAIECVGWQGTSLEDFNRANLPFLVGSCLKVKFGINQVMLIG